MAAVITNIDREHLDHYGTEAALREAFLAFANKVPFYGLVVICADDPGAAALAPDLLKRHVTYGLHGGDYRGEVLETTPQGTRFVVRVRGELRGPAHIRMPGVHYAQNALAALAVADFFGDSIRRLPGGDGRPGRRGSPLLGARARPAASWWSTTTATTPPRSPPPSPPLASTAAGWWWPSSPTATAAPATCSTDFAPALAGADLVVLTDIYAAGEPPLDGITIARLLATFPAIAPRSTPPAASSATPSSISCAPAISSSPSAPATSPSSPARSSRGGSASAGVRSARAGPLLPEEAEEDGVADLPELMPSLSQVAFPLESLALEQAERACIVWIDVRLHPMKVQGLEREAEQQPDRLRGKSLTPGAPAEGKADFSPAVCSFEVEEGTGPQHLLGITQADPHWKKRRVPKPSWTFSMMSVAPARLCSGGELQNFATSGSPKMARIAGASCWVSHRRSTLRPDSLGSS